MSRIDFHLAISEHTTMQTTDEMFSGNGSDTLYDVFAGLGYDFTPERLRGLFEALPEHIRDIAHSWGLSDTVFRDEAYVFYRDMWANHQPE